MVSRTRTRTFVVGLLIFATISAATADAPRTDSTFVGQISAGTVKGTVSVEGTDDQLQVNLSVGYSSLPSDLRNRKVIAFDWKRVKIWVLTDDGKIAAPLPPSQSPFGISGPGITWILSFRFEHAEAATAVVLQVDSTFQIFPIHQPVK